MFIFKADIEFHNPETINMARGSDLIFRAKNAREAAIGVMKWIKNRQEAIPDYFGECLAVKIDLFIIEAFEDDGMLHTRIGEKVFEWKIDNIQNQSLEEKVKEI